MSITKLLTINSTEITEHNRKISISEKVAASDIDLASGHRRRYYSRNKREFSLSWSYLPSLQSKTVDSRVGRDFLYSLANGSSVATVGIELEPGAGASFIDCYISSYSEGLIRREYETQCSYYDVSISLTER
jgi:hypothetical protein